MSNAYLPRPDPLEEAPRYTTVAEVKVAMGITSDKYDAKVTQSIITLEWLIDSWLSTQFPQDADPNAGTDEALDPPPIEGIPQAVRYAALTGAVKVMRLTEVPGGSDDLIGAIDFGNESRRAFNAVKPLLMNLQRGWGVS